MRGSRALLPRLRRPPENDIPNGSWTPFAENAQVYPGMKVGDETRRKGKHKHAPSLRLLCNGDVTSGLLPLLDVQFWETENGWRLDHSHRRGHRRNIPYLVDASDVRIVNAPNKARA